MIRCKCCKCNFVKHAQNGESNEDWCPDCNADLDMETLKQSLGVLLLQMSDNGLRGVLGRPEAVTEHVKAQALSILSARKRVQGKQ